jgi:3-deoxy-D-manno-octulosonic-acid transferase
MPRPPLLYRTAALLARAAIPVMALVRPRLRQMSRERRELWRQLRGAPVAPRTLLLHAASAGELRQIEPLIQQLRATWPEDRLVVTWFSTSGAPVAWSLGVDLCGALPWDTPWETAAFLNQLKPSLIVVGKLDLWPELAWQAERRRIPVVLVAATVRDSSSRLAWPTRAMLTPAYTSLAAVGAISEHDATRLVQLGVPRSRITVTGDPRYDSVLARLGAAMPVARDPLLLVAGSTWPVDEILVLNAFAEVRARHPTARLLISPHQPTAAVLERIAGLAGALALPAPDTRVASGSPLIVDLSVGQLALTYRMGALAYVGGGFNLSGPHSVIEPAATGVPVAIGRMSTTLEAHLLEAAGGLTQLDNDGALNEMPAWWSRYLDDPAAAARAGEAARRVVEEERGAAEASVALIQKAVREAGERSG